MKKMLAIVVAGLLITSIGFAQDVTPAAKAGSKSLNFTFNGLGTFGLNGTGPSAGAPTAGIGVSYFLSNDAAVRVGFQIGSQSSTIPANPPAGVSGTDGSTSAFVLGVTGDYLMYMNAGRVRPYWGGGVMFTLSTNDSKNAVVGGGTQTEVKNAPPAGTSFGLMGICGAEFFLYPELSLSAEYNLNLFSVTSNSDQEVINGSTTTTTKMGSTTTILGFGAAGATLHIYF